MLVGELDEVVLQILNLGLGLVGLGLMGRGFFYPDGLAGLGLILLMTSIICYVGFRFAVEQTKGLTRELPPVPRLTKVETFLDRAS